MKKRIFAFIMAIFMLISVQSAYAMVTDSTTAGVLEGFIQADTIVEATCKSIKPYRDPNMPQDAEVWYEDFTPNFITVTVDKILYGKPIKEKEVEVLIGIGYGVQIEVGKRYVFALHKNSVDEQTTDNWWSINPGLYSCYGIMRIEKDGNLTGLDVDTHPMGSFDDVINMIEGRVMLPNDNFNDSACMYYNKQLMVRAYATKTTNVYQKQNIKSKKLLTLLNYDFVVQVGSSDYVNGKNWDKILMADGTLGFVLAGSLKSLPYSIDANRNTIIKVPKTVRLRNGLGVPFAVGRIVKGTAVIMQDNNYSEESLKYLTICSSMYEYSKVTKWDFVCIDRPKNVKFTKGFHNFSIDMSESD